MSLRTGIFKVLYFYLRSKSCPACHRLIFGRNSNFIYALTILCLTFIFALWHQLGTMKNHVFIEEGKQKQNLFLFTQHSIQSPFQIFCFFDLKMNIWPRCKRQMSVPFTLQAPSFMCFGATGTYFLFKIFFDFYHFLFFFYCRIQSLFDHKFLGKYFL